MIKTEEEYKQKMAKLELVFSSISMTGGFSSAPQHLLDILEALSYEIEKWETEHYPMPIAPPNEEI